MRTRCVFGNVMRLAMTAGVIVVLSGCGGSGSDDDGISPTRIGTVTGRPGAYQIVAIAPDSDYILMGDESTNIVKLVTVDGAILWEYTLPVDSTLESGAVADDASIVVVGAGNGKLFAFSKEGVLLWQKDRPGEEVAVAVTDDGSKVFAGGGVGTMSCYTREGFELWARDTNTRGWTLWGISCSSDGTRLILRTNSDIIFCNGNGVEISIFDVIDGNQLISADISGDGTMFAVGFTDGAAFRVALYHIVDGEIWRQAVDNYAAVSVDSYGDVFATVQDHDNVIFGSDGATLATWSGGGYSISVDNEGLVCAVGMVGDVAIYQIQ